MAGYASAAEDLDELVEESEDRELFSDSEEESSYAGAAESAPSTSDTVAETLSDIKALLENVVRKVESNEAAIKELKEQFTRFEIYLILLNINILGAIP